MLLRFVFSPARPRLGRDVARFLWMGAASSFAPLVVVQAQVIQAQNAASTGSKAPTKVRPQLTLPSPPQSAIARSYRAVALRVPAKRQQPSLVSLPREVGKLGSAETEAAAYSAAVANGGVGPSKTSVAVTRAAPEIVAPIAPIALIAPDQSKSSGRRRVETWAPSGGREDSLLSITRSAPLSTAAAPVASLNNITGASTRMALASPAARPGAAQLPSRGGLVLKPKAVELRSAGTAPSESPVGSVAGAILDASRNAKSREVPAVSAPAVSASERLMLARLDADLGRAQSRLNRAESRLSEGQKQLGSFTDVLRDAMLDAGDDAHGLHPFVRVAQRYLGTPYVWGGESARGFDCSGFIMRVMRDLGYRALPHSAAEQFRYGLPVAKPLLKAGDVVFFANTYKPGISHVGIYLGHGRFIHAANSHVGTIVSSLSEPKWVEKYAGARRLLPVNS